MAANEIPFDKEEVDTIVRSLRNYKAHIFGVGGGKQWAEAEFEQTQDLIEKLNSWEIK